MLPSPFPARSSPTPDSTPPRIPIPGQSYRRERGEASRGRAARVDFAHFAPPCREQSRLRRRCCARRGPPNRVDDSAPWSRGPQGCLGHQQVLPDSAPLATLDVERCGAGRGAAALRALTSVLQRPLPPSLCEVRLSGNGFGAAGKKALWEALAGSGQSVALGFGRPPDNLSNRVNSPSDER